MAPDIPSTPPLLSFRNVSKDYARNDDIGRVIHHVNLDIFQGRHLGLIGHSGAGKSTLARLALGLEPPTEGLVLFEGAPVTNLGKAMRKKVQIIFQDPMIYLNPYYTVKQIISEPLEVFFPKWGKRKRLDRMAELLDAVGLYSGLLERKPHELSGGQCQRVAVARALGLGPSLLICDEPFTNIDADGREALLRLFRDPSFQNGLTFWLISHDFEAVDQLCRETAVIKRGRIIEHGPTQQVLADPGLHRHFAGIP